MNRDQLKANVLEIGIWKRGLYMLLFVLIYNVAEFVVMAIAVFQFLFKLITGRTNPRLRSFGGDLSVFVGQIWRFLTFNGDRLPFPFNPWPTLDEAADPLRSLPVDDDATNPRE
jgi:hypothetical protein